MCSLNVPLGAIMVFGGCPVPSTGGFGCSASVRSQMVSIHQLWAISWKAMYLKKLFSTSYDVHGGQRVKILFTDKSKINS